MTPKLVPDWRSAWRWASVQAAALSVAWGSLPADVQASVLAAIGVPAARVPAILGVIVIVGRMIDQGRRS